MTEPRPMPLPTEQHEPYVTVVVTTRNDDHGGDPLKRLQAFVNTFAAQCRRTGLDAEVIVVEWNPAADRPRVSELLRIPLGAPFDVQFVEVPPEIHRRFRHADVLPLFQMIAKNAGIRRARGRFILATNIDIIFSNELVEYLASRRLIAGHLYRVDRHDIEPDFPVDGALEEQMAYCRTHQLRINARSGTHAVDSIGREKALDSDIAASAEVTLGPGWHVREGNDPEEYCRWAKREAHFSVDMRADRSAHETLMLDLEIEPNPYQPGSWVELELLEGQNRVAVRRVSRHVTVRIPLKGPRVRRDFVLRMLDSSGGREWLPFFEYRDELCYRVVRIAVNPVPTHGYDVALWRLVDGGPTLKMERTILGVAIATERARYAPAARYVPFESATDAACEFLVEHVTQEGRFVLSVMDDARECWLPSRVVEVDEDGTTMSSLTFEVPRGTRFSLYISNHRAEGGVSRFVLRSMRGSVPFDQLRRREPVRLSVRPAALVREAAARPLRWLRAASSSIERGRAQRFEDLITDESLRVRELEAQVATLAPLAELAPFARLLRENRPAQMHQNACGDFQLMARDDWFSVRGYPELEMFSMGLDGVLEAVACAAGIVEHVFEAPLCIYHLEHQKGSGWTPEGEQMLRKRIAESGITWLDAASVHIWATYMQWLKRPMIFNGSGWGLADVDLPETTLRPVAHTP